MSYDIITVGGGLAGCTVALRMARLGARVLVLERQRTCTDRVRGEGIHPWGVEESRKIGIHGMLSEFALEVPYWTHYTSGRGSPRDLKRTTPHHSPCLTFYHPEMQEHLLLAVQAAGAEVVRGARVSGVVPGSPATVTARLDGSNVSYRTRLVVGADGRGSRVRRWAGFEVCQDQQPMAIAGVLLAGMSASDASVHDFRRSDTGETTFFFPLGDTTFRCYFCYPKVKGGRSLSGSAAVPRLIESCIDLGVPAEWMSSARSAGPLAEFDCADSWVEHPYRDGVALLGDAAASSDPTWGQGLSLAILDARELCECLSEEEDWDAAAHEYAVRHDRNYGIVHRICGWFRELFLGVGSEAEAIRARALPKLARDISRLPDVVGLGPNAPSTEADRQRFFGEN